jgi:hypothetical protein
MHQRAEELMRQAQEMDVLRTKLKVHDAPAMEALVQEAHVLVEESARMAQTLPRIEAQRYYMDVQRNDRQLYEQLLEERKLEAETHRLAQEIRSLQPGEVRTERLNTLRQKLLDSFELKQENRRREITQLERQLEGLQLRLHERERLRDRIIEERLRELIGERDAREW